LAKAGYFGGDPERVLNAPADIVIETFEFEVFQSEYSDVEYEINKPD